MSRAVLVVALALAALVPAAAAAAPARAASVRLMVVGRERALRDAGPVVLRDRTVRVGARRCTVAGATPLGVLAGTRLKLRLRDYGSCGRRAADASGLFVTRIGTEANRGRDGWVYKVGRRAGTAGAGDVAGPFGRGRLRRGARVLWFWCRMGRDGGCQRTLEVTASRATAAPGAPVHVLVRGYDDEGRGIAVGGAAVRLGASTATTGDGGTAVLTAPARRGSALLRAQAPGMVRAFPVRVAVR